MYAVALGAHDRAIFDPQWAIACRHTGHPNTLSANAYTMGQLFKDAGYATAIFGKWHLGSAPQSLPSAHGFDEFYGIPPDTSWNDEMTVSLIDVDTFQ